MAESTYGNRTATDDLQAGNARSFPDPRFSQPEPQQYGDRRTESAESDGQGVQEKAMEQASHARDIAAEKTSQVAEKVHESADAGVNRAAEGLEQAAMQLRERAEDGGGVQEKVGVRVADGLDKTSVYLRDHEAQEIWTDVEKFVKEHPMQAAVGAALAGYIVAKVLK